MEGIERGLKLCDPCNLNLYDVPASLVREYDCLPSNLNEAIKAARNSEFVHRALPEKIIDAYLSAKTSEWNRYVDAPDKSAMIDSLYFSAY